MATLTKNRKGSRQNGFSMVEVLIALALLGIVGTGFLAVLTNSSTYTIRADIRATAESIARSQMEYIKSLPYDGVNNPPTYPPQSPLPGASWRVITNSPAAARLDPKGIGSTNIDEGIQKITVRVQYNYGGTWTDVFTLEGYKYAG
jgi:prepilin-type N-terminal cleavage/methylation domain-containing protein